MRVKKLRVLVEFWRLTKRESPPVTWARSRRRGGKKGMWLGEGGEDGTTSLQ